MVPDSLWLSVEFNNILVASERCCGAKLELRRFTSMASYVSNICAFDGNLHFLIRKVCLTTMLQMLMGRARDKSLCQTHSNDFVMSSERKASEEGFRLEINQKIFDASKVSPAPADARNWFIPSNSQPIDTSSWLIKFMKKIESFATNFPYTLFICKWNILSLKFMASKFPFSPVFMQYIICFRKNICT